MRWYIWRIYTKYVLIGFGASTVGSCLGSVRSFMQSDEPFDTKNMYLQFKIMYATIIIREMLLSFNFHKIFK